MSAIRRNFLIAALGIITGAIASLASILFVSLVEFANQLLLFVQNNREGEGHGPWFSIFFILIPVLGGLIVGLLSMATPEKRPLTLVDTIRNAQTLNFDNSTKSGLITALSAIVALGSGAPVGQYGPLAHMGATLGTWVAGITRSTGFTATTGLGCGAAAAIATAFNAPIAGLIFAHEVIIRHYSLRSFAPVTVASVTGYLIANYVFVRPALLEVEVLQQIHASEFLIFIVIGIIGAYVAIALMKSVLIARVLSKKLRIPEYLKPASAGMVVGIVAIWIPEVMQVGDSVVFDSIRNDVFYMQQMLVILIAKLLLTALCLGFGMAGGIFSPALVIGILMGSIIGGIAPTLLADNFSGHTIYAICGMVAVASPVMGAPLTGILIVFELTRNYELAIAAMISVVFANLVACSLFGRSLFDIQLHNSGYDLRLGRDKVTMQGQQIKAYIVHDFVRVSVHRSTGELRDRLLDSGRTEGYVVDDELTYCGTISLSKILELQQQGDLAITECGAVAQREQETLLEDTSVWDAMQKIQNFIGESIPVVKDYDTYELVGVVYESSIIQAYMERLEQVRKEEYDISHSG